MSVDLIELPAYVQYLKSFRKNTFWLNAWDGHCFFLCLSRAVLVLVPDTYFIKPDTYFITSFQGRQP